MYEKVPFNFYFVDLGAHMFIFYFAILSIITPPVALASCSAAGIAKSNLSKMGWTSMLLAGSSFLIPFAFVINPAILLIVSEQDSSLFKTGNF